MLRNMFKVDFLNLFFHRNLEQYTFPSQLHKQNILNKQGPAEKHLAVPAVVFVIIIVLHFTELNGKKV